MTRKPAGIIDAGDAENRTGAPAAVASGSDSPVAVKDPSGVYLLASRSLCDFLGCEPASIIGKSDEDLFPPDQVEAFRKDLDIVVREGRSIKREARVSGRNGACWMEIETSPLADGRGVVTMMRDLSDRKRKEGVLLEVAAGIAGVSGEAFFHALIRKLASVLEADYAFVGSIKEPGSRWVRTRALCVDGAVMDNFEYHLDGTPCDNVVSGELCLYRRDVQDLFPADHLLREMAVESYAGVPLFDSGQRFLGLMVVLFRRPITDEDTVRSVLSIFAIRVAAELERQAVEEALRQSEREKTAILNGLGNIRISYVDQDLNAIWTNVPSHEPAFLCTSERIREMGAAGCPLLQSLETGKLASGECAVEGGRTFLVQSTPVRDGRDAISGVVHIAIDISARKAMEEELEAAREKAESASMAKSSFLSTMSHEIRTPLNGVLGMLQLLKDTGLSGEQEELAQAGEESARILLEMINDILAFCRIEANECTLEQQPFSIAGLVEQMARTFGPRAREKGVEIECVADLDPTVPVIGDMSAFRQILAQLVDNAVKFTERGKVSLWVTRDTNGALRLEVEDTGIGIPPHDMARVCEPFTQLDGSLSRRFGGSGLGLSIVRRLVELMRGRLVIESEPGRGTLVRVVFDSSSPVSESGPETGDGTGRDREGREPVREGARPTRVLLADDEPLNRKALSRLLTKRGFRVDTAENGPEALELAAGKAYAIILMDIEMPGMDGLEAARTIRDPENGLPSRDAAILAMTAHQDYTRVADGAGSVFSGLVIKPVGIEDLVLEMEKALARAEKGAASC